MREEGDKYLAAKLRGGIKTSLAHPREMSHAQEMHNSYEYSTISLQVQPLAIESHVPEHYCEYYVMYDSNTAGDYNL